MYVCIYTYVCVCVCVYIYMCVCVFMKVSYAVLIYLLMCIGDLPEVSRFTPHTSSKIVIYRDSLPSSQETPCLS